MEKVSVIAQLKMKKPSDTMGTVIIRGYFNRRPVASKSTGYKIKRDDWDIEKKCVKKSAHNADLLNACIQKRLIEIQSQLLTKEIMGAAINSKHVADIVIGFNSSKDFIEYCKSRIEEDYENTETKKSYLSECSKLLRFKPYISFADIDSRFLQLYKNYMKKELRNTNNTVWKSLKFMYLIINKAINEGGIITINPFDSFDRGKYKRTVKEYLTVQNEGERKVRRKIKFYNLDILYLTSKIFVLVKHDSN